MMGKLGTTTGIEEVRWSYAEATADVWKKNRRNKNVFKLQTSGGGRSGLQASTETYLKGVPELMESENAWRDGYCGPTMPAVLVSRSASAHCICCRRSTNEIDGRLCPENRFGVGLVFELEEVVE